MSTREAKVTWMIVGRTQCSAAHEEHGSMWRSRHLASFCPILAQTKMFQKYQLRKKKEEETQYIPFHWAHGGSKCMFVIHVWWKAQRYFKGSVHQVLCVNYECLWWLVNSHNRSSCWLTRGTSISAQAVSVLPNWIWALALDLYAQVDWQYCRRFKPYFSPNETPVSASWSQTLWSNWLASDMVFAVSRLPRGFNMVWRLGPLC